MFDDVSVIPFISLAVAPEGPHEDSGLVFVKTSWAMKQGAEWGAGQRGKHGKPCVTLAARLLRSSQITGIRERGISMSPTHPLLPSSSISHPSWSTMSVYQCTPEYSKITEVT